MERRRIVRLVPIGLLVMVILPGCQSVHLREASLNQADSYGDIQQRQVLDNLAKFVYDINSFPSFAYSAQGTNQVQDQLSLASTSNWQRIAAGISAWSSTSLAPSAQRQFYQNWVLQPLNDPRKLDLMRCAYQQVVRANFAARGLAGDEGDAAGEGGMCPDCARRFNTFYTGDANNPTPPPGDPKDSGRITNLCLGANPTWFGWGCKKELPKHCKYLKVGRYRDVYVWVLPGGENELSKLTLAILDYAVNVPAQAPAPVMKQVTYLVDANGNPTTQADAVGTVTGSVPVNKPSSTLLDGDLSSRRAALEAKLNRHRAEMANDPAAPADAALQRRRQNEVDALQNEIQSLKQLEATRPTVPDLPTPYRPSIDESSGPNLLQLQLRLQSLQPLPSLSPNSP